MQEENNHQSRLDYQMPTSISTPIQSPKSVSSSRSCKRLVPYFPYSPKLQASMVGSYEESLIQGRMSARPSSPFNFFAEIGVLGLGKCKSSLKSPPHLNLSFPAVFYSHGSSIHNQILEPEVGQSPYVGYIDLERSNFAYPRARATKMKQNYAKKGTKCNYMNDETRLDSHIKNQTLRYDLSNPEGSELTRSVSYLPPPGGYRIPEAGQVQVIVRNPNKVVVKVFLVPYNLSGMKPGTKTFIRQRTYSTIASADQQLKFDTHSSVTRPSNRRIIHFVIHLQICSPSRDHFYLYRSIRIIFENRKPDYTDKFCVEASLPEPRFSFYKPDQSSNYNFSAN